MGFRFTDTAEGLHYDETGRTLGWRAAFGLAGAIALAASGIFIVLLRGAVWTPDAAHLGGIAASVLGLAAFWAFGIFCLYIALLAPQQRIVFHLPSRQLVRTLAAPLRPRGRPPQHIPFGSIGELAVREQPSDDGPPTFCIALPLKGSAHPLRLGIFPDRAAAAQALQRVHAALGR